MGIRERRPLTLESEDLAGSSLAADQELQQGWRDAQPLRALATPAEDLGSDTSSHMAAYNHLLLRVQGLQCPLLASVGARHVCTHSYVQANTHIK